MRFRLALAGVVVVALAVIACSPPPIKPVVPSVFRLATPVYVCSHFSPPAPLPSTVVEFIAPIDGHFSYETYQATVRAWIPGLWDYDYKKGARIRFTVPPNTTWRGTIFRASLPGYVPATTTGAPPVSFLQRPCL